MTILLWITATILTFHATQSYILLTANLEDVQAIAKQISQSPVADQLTKIWRRAADQFAVDLQKPAKSTHQSKRDYDIEVPPPAPAAPHRNSYPQMRSFGDQPPQESEAPQRNYQEYRNRDDEELIALGRNTSRYLKSIRKIFEKN